MADDIDLLQGTWAISALEMDGQETAAAMLEEARIIIKGDRFTSIGMCAMYEGTLKLANSKKPSQGTTFEPALDTGLLRGKCIRRRAIIQ